MRLRRRSLLPRYLAARLSWLASPIAALLLLAGCRAAQPSAAVPPPETPSAVLRLGVAGGAENLAAVLGRFGEGAGSAQSIQFIYGSDDRLLVLLEAGYLDGALVYYLPPNRGLWLTPVAVDAVVALVHPSNPIVNLSLEQLRAAFAGRIANWSQLGGPNRPIDVVVREPGAGVRDWFVDLVLAGQPLAPTAFVAAADAALAAEVAARPGSLGLSVLGASADRTALMIDGIQAAPQTAARQQYPLSLPVYLVVPQEPTGPLRSLLSWLQSAAGQSLVGEIYGPVR